MTIMLSDKTLGDRVLAFLGKKRRLRMPVHLEEEWGPYATAAAERESFWRALLRSRNAPLREGELEWPDEDEKLDASAAGPHKEM